MWVRVARVVASVSILAAALLIPSGLVVAAPSGIAERPTIVNGVPAGEFGFVVAVLSADALDGGRPFDSQFCGGTLTTPTTVVTAAHCVVADGSTVVSSPRDVVVGFGHDTGKPMRLVRVVSVAANPAYLTDDTNADVAVLTLSSAVSDVAPLPPASPAEAIPLTAGGAPATTVGWGNTATAGHKYPTELREAALVVFPTASCGGAGRSFVVAGVRYSGYGRADVNAAEMLCAAGVSEGHYVSTCDGDSGGPLIGGAGPAARLIGTVSWGSACGSDTPSVFGRVSAAYAFLAAHGAVTAPGPPSGSPTVAAAPINGGFVLTFSAGSVSVPVTAVAASIVDPATGRVFSCAPPAGVMQCRIVGLVNGTSYKVTAIAGTAGGNSAVSTAIVAAPAAVPDPGAIVRAVQVRGHEVYFRVSMASGNGSTLTSWAVTCVSPSGVARSATVSVAGRGGDAWIAGLPHATYRCWASAQSSVGTGSSLAVSVRVG